MHIFRRHIYRAHFFVHFYELFFTLDTTFADNKDKPLAYEKCSVKLSLGHLLASRPVLTFNTDERAMPAL